MKPRVLIADDHRMLADAYARVLADDYEVVGTVADGRELIEVAPGIDLDRDILALMPFKPRVDNPKLMEAALFRPEPLGLRDRMLDIHIEDRLSYDPESNTWPRLGTSR